MGKLFAIAVICALAIVIFCGILFCITEGWKDFNGKSNVRIRFDQFLSLYTICPNKYNTDEDRLIYTGGRSYERTPLSFSYMDYCRYKRWLKRMKKENFQKKQLNEKQQFLECAQRDLDEYRKQAAKEVEDMKTKLGA